MMKNRLLKKILCISLLTVSVLGLTSIGANAEWRRNLDSSWSYYKLDGTKVTGWLKDVDGKYYYLDDNGLMLTNKWIDNYYVGVDGAWITNTTILKTNENTYVKKQADVKDAEEDEDNYDYSSYHKKKVKDNTNTSSSTNETTSDESNSDTTSSTSDDYYDYSSKGSNETWVSGYYRNGKYVSGYYRTKKDSTTSNNYSHEGNTNPHNGKRGYSKK